MDYLLINRNVQFCAIEMYFGAFKQFYSFEINNYTLYFVPEKVESFQAKSHTY
jgi:hypothetical protein